MQTCRLFSSLLLSVVIASAGCQTARYVVKQPDGGIVAIPSDTNLWPEYNRDQAEKLMLQHFPQGYEIEKEEEIVVGSVTTNHQTTDTDHFGPFTLNERVSNTVSTSNQTEWRITYRPKQ